MCPPERHGMSSYFCPLRLNPAHLAEVAISGILWAAPWTWEAVYLLLFEGSVLAYDPAANGAKWVPVRGTTSDLSPAEDASAQELSNITIPDPPEDMWRLDHFGEHQDGTMWRPLPRPSTLVLLSARSRRQWSRHHLTGKKLAAKA